MNVLKMKDLKKADDHIREFRDLMSGFEAKFQSVMTQTKKTFLAGLQNDIKTYRRIWSDFYNKEILNKEVKKSNIEILEFEDEEFLNDKFENLKKTPPKKEAPPPPSGTAID